MKTKEQLINKIISDNNYKSYLEIGTQAGHCYNQIECEHKIGVDPYPKKKVENQIIGTSDNFFANYKGKFDIIFIDGLHHSTQLMADIVNSASILNHDGMIVVHDLMPTSKETQKVPRKSIEWYGDCWKCWHLLNNTDYDIKLELFAFDCGIGTIKLGRNGLDDLLCGFSDNLEKLIDITYDKDYGRYEPNTKD